MNPIKLGRRSSDYYSRTMILGLALLSHLASGDGLVVPDPGWFLVTKGTAIAAYPERPVWESPVTRWTGSFAQLRFGLLGSVVGPLLGGAVGYGVGSVVGGMAFGDRPEAHDAAPFYRVRSAEKASQLGLVVGAVLGEVGGTGFFVSQAAQENYASRGPWIPMVGALMGLGTGAILGTATAAAVDDGSGDLIWLPLVGIAIGPAIGAVVADRLTAQAPMAITVTPWIPRSGLEGLRVGLRF